MKQPESEAALLPPLSREASWAPSQQSLQLEGCDHFHPVSAAHSRKSKAEESGGCGVTDFQDLFLAYLIPNSKGTRCIKNLTWITRLSVTLHTFLLIVISTMG